MLALALLEADGVAVGSGEPPLLAVLEEDGLEADGLEALALADPVLLVVAGEVAAAVSPGPLVEVW